MLPVLVLEHSFRGMIVHPAMGAVVVFLSADFLWRSYIAERRSGVWATDGVV